MRIDDLSRSRKAEVARKHCGELLEYTPNSTREKRSSGQHTMHSHKAMSSLGSSISLIGGAIETGKAGEDVRGSTFQSR